MNFIKPIILPADQLPKLIKALPKYSPFSLSGIAVFDGRLYAGSNLGVIEVDGAGVSNIIRFHRTHSVVSRVTFDIAHRRLWADDDESGDFLRFDGDRWTQVKWPISDKGYYTRNDVGLGPRLISNHEGLWLTLAGGTWAWDEPSMKWVPIGPSVPQRMDSGDGTGVIGIIPIGTVPLLIIRHEGRFVGGRRGQQITQSDEIVAMSDSSRQIKRDAKPFMADSWAVAEDAGYICTTDHALIRVSNEVVSAVSAPGDCEAVSSDGEMNLLASISHKGVFRYTPTGGWTPIAGAPYPEGSGSYWSYLASSENIVAVAIDGKPVVDPKRATDKRMYFTRDAPTALWRLEHGRFVLIPFQ